MTEKTITVYLQQQSDYRFDIHFDDNMPVLTSDEPAPLGTGAGPSPVQLLCAAVGNCLSDSLLFAFRKFKQAPEPIHCEVQAQLVRAPRLVSNFHLHNDADNRKFGCFGWKVTLCNFWGYYTKYYTVIKNTRKSLIYMGL